MAECPTCNGTGAVPAHIAEALTKAHTSGAAGATCHCDGPPHPYAPRWSPKSGPVTGR